MTGTEQQVVKREVWTSGDVGRFFGSDSQAARRWVKDPKTDFPQPFRNPQGHWRWEPAAVREWARKNGWPVAEEG